MADEQTQFEAILLNLMSPDSDIRTPTEEAYEGIPVIGRIPLLVRVIQSQGCKQDVRTMAAVLLRRLYTSSFDEIKSEISGIDVLNKAKVEMLIAVQNETDNTIRKKICDATAELARNMIDETGENNWPEVVNFLFECAGSDNTHLIESALNIFGTVPGIFGSQQAQYADVIKQMLQKSITHSLPAVRFSAAHATMSFLLVNEKDSALLIHFKDFLPAILSCVEETIQGQEDFSLLKSLIDVAETLPKYLKGHLEHLVNLCLKIVGEEELSDQWRQLGLEVIVTLSETAAAMLRKNSKFLSILVPQILSLMVDIEEEENWSVADDVEDEDNDSNAIAGESALDRMACGLGGNAMLPLILTSVTPLLQNADWKCRHAGLMAISAAGEGCHKQMETMLNDVVEAVIPFLNDVHPRVRYAACNALGQMSTDFGPSFQKKFHDRVVPGLLHVMDDYDNPRVQAHAGAALVNFSEECPKNVITPYLDTIISKLEQVLNAKFKELVEKGTKLVLEQVVTTLASVADTAEEKFITYYDRFIPCLKYIITNANSDELKMLRGKTIECISLIGLAVGKEKFMSDCSDVMQLLLKTQTEQATELADDDPQISYMISAWARMCKIMGKDFVQFLPLVMGPVLKAASLKPEIALVDSDDMKSMDGDTDWQFVTLGDQQNFGIRTAGLEEKATACQMLMCYARELKEGFADYVEQVVKIMLNHLKFYFHDGVRLSAAESLPHLLECALIKGPTFLNDMWNLMCSDLIKAIETEPEVDIKSEYLNSLGLCIEKMGNGCLTQEYIDELIVILEKILTDHFDRQNTRLEQRKDEDYDELVEESLIDEDDQDVYLLSKVSDIMHALFGTYKTATIPIFEKLLSLFSKLLHPSQPWSNRQWALCIFDDLIEHTGSISFDYKDYFLDCIVKYVCDKQPEVRQAASYGIGVMAQYGGENYAQVCGESIPLLMQVIKHPEARVSENLSATENAISALTKILKYNNRCTNVDEVLPHWLFSLPVWEDEDEAVHIFSFLCELIEKGNTTTIGPNHCNLPHILAVMAEAFVRECLKKETELTERMARIINEIKGNTEIYQACMSHLTEAQLQAIQVLSL